MSDVFTNMKITVFKNSTTAFCGRGTVLIAGTVDIDFSIMKGKNGVFASLPSIKGSKLDENGKIKYYNVVRLPSKEVYDELQILAKQEYEKVVNGQEAAGEENQVSDNLPF